MAYIDSNIKIMQVGAANNNADLARMQASVISIYDTYDLALGGTLIPFFQSVNNKSFPFTNLSQNRFTAGKSFSVQSYSLSVITRTAGGQFLRVMTIDESTFPQLALGELSLIVSNTQVIDRYPIINSVGPFNRDAKFQSNANTVIDAVDNVKYRSQAVDILPAQPVILPDQEFVANLQLPAYTAPATDTVYLRLTMRGFGTLFSPNGTI